MNKLIHPTYDNKGRKISDTFIHWWNNTTPEQVELERLKKEMENKADISEILKEIVNNTNELLAKPDAKTILREILVPEVQYPTKSKKEKIALEAKQLSAKRALLALKKLGAK